MSRPIKKSLDEISFQFSQNNIEETSKSSIPFDLPF